MDYDKLGWLKASQYRQNILVILSKQICTPKDISIETGYYLSHVSNTISELKKRGLVECLTPQRKKGRIYKTTKEGNFFVKKIK